MKVNCKTKNGFCGNCCYNTEMLLTEEDERRIESLGYRKEEFSVVVDGVRRLRNVNGKCFFLENNMCRIYEHRPEGCRLYPAVYNGRDIIVDKFCPKWREIKITESDKKALLKLIKKIYGYVKLGD